MKNFYPDSAVNRLLDIIYAPMYAKTILGGIELDVFSQLQEGKKYTEIAEKLDLNPKNTEHLLNALTAIGLLEKNGGYYKNTRLSNKYLVKDSDLYIGEYLRTTSILFSFDDIDIVRLVKDGPSSRYADKKGLEAHAMFGDYTEMLKNSQKGGRSAEIAALVTSLPEFAGFKKMLDLGGGPGLLGMAVVKAHPAMQGIIFDTPAVGKIAVEAIKEYGMEDRMTVLTGDYLSDSIGEGYDLIMAIGALNFAKHDLDALIRKIYEALSPHGVFVCISEGLTHQKTRPKDMVIGWLPSYLKGCDFSLEQGDISDVVLRTGFRSVYKRTMNLLIGEMDVDIARK